MRLIFIYSSSFIILHFIYSFLLASLYIEIMGAKSSKAAVIIDPSKANIYDTFSNYQDTTATDDAATDDVAIDYMKEFWYIQAVITAFILIYSVSFYTTVYLRRRTKYSYK